MGSARIGTDIGRLGLLIGGMKCGSTTLFSSLAAHPEIAPSRPKEPSFFSFEPRYRRGMGWYERRFRLRPRHRVALDGSPSYSKVHAWPDAPRRIGRLDADVRIVYVMRDPVARIRSHVRHAMAAPWGRHIVEGPPGLPEAAVQGSDYATHLDAYARHVGREAILPVRLRDLRREPGATLARIQEHLGVEPMPLGLRTKNRAEPVVWEARSGWRAAHRSLPWPLARRGLRAAAYHGRRVPGLRSLLFKRRGDLPLPKGWEQEARRRLAVSMRRLERDWGIDVSPWGF